MFGFFYTLQPLLSLPFPLFQAIKAACEVNVLGDQLNPHQLAAADDLYYLRIPSSWLAMSRGTAPPPNQALGTWLTDLTNRCQHLEKILVLVGYILTSVVMTFMEPFI